MTTIRQIISNAYEESRLIPLGATPENEEFNKGLRLIKVSIASLFGNEMGERLEDVSFGSTSATSHSDGVDLTTDITQTFIPSNTRLICSLSTDSTIYLPPNPRPGARISIIDVSGNFSTNSLTLNGNGRKIEASTSLVLSTDSINREWFYRDDLADWVRISALDENSSSPFPEEFDDLLTIMLAIRLSPGFGKTVSPESASSYNRTRALFRARYRQTKQMPVELALRSNRTISEFSTGNI